MRVYNKPDLSAPRFRKKHLGFINDDFFKEIKEEYPELQKYSHKEIKNLIKAFNQEVWQTVVEVRDGVELLDQLGYIFIGTCQRAKKDNPDREKSLNLGVEVKYQNWESDQYLAKIFYTNFETKYRFKFHELWGFIATRDFTRAAGGENYRKNWKKYLVVDYYTQISKLFRKSMAKDYMVKKDKLKLEDYDEFNMDI